MTKSRVTVLLDQPRQIEFTNVARYRMGTIERPFDFADLRNGRRAYAALVSWTWACLVSEDAAAFPKPENLIPHIHTENQAAVMEALCAAVNSSTLLEQNSPSSQPKPAQSPSST